MAPGAKGRYPMRIPTALSALVFVWAAPAFATEPAATIAAAGCGYVSTSAKPPLSEDLYPAEIKRIDGDDVRKLNRHRLPVGSHAISIQELIGSTPRGYTKLRKLGNREMECIVLLNLAMVAVSRGNEARAVDPLRQVIAFVEETGSPQAMQSLFEVAAGLAASRGEWERAARLFGAAERHVEETDYRRDPADEAYLSSWIAKTRAALGDARFAAEAAAGQSAAYAAEVAVIGHWLTPLA